MTLPNPQKIFIKNQNIQDSNDCLNKEANSNMKNSFTKKSFSTPINNLNIQIFINNNNFKQINYSPEQKESNQSILQANTMPKKIDNSNINPLQNLTSPINIKDEFLLKENCGFLYQMDDNLNENNNSIINDNNKLIKPTFYYGLNNLNNYQNDKFPLNTPLQGLNEFNNFQNDKFSLNTPLQGLNTEPNVKKEDEKKIRIFNKFKVFRIEQKKGREKNPHKMMHKRKYNSDDIRKKIKARFHKSIKNIINENLKHAGSKHIFSFLPQIFISSISREQNRQVLNLTYRELLQKDFLSNVEDSKYKNKKGDLVKYRNNLNTLKYLDKNPDICEKSGFDLISKMKYGDLLEEYFRSREFDKAVNKLYEENEKEEYVREYIKKAKTYIKFFSEIPIKINRNKDKKE